MDETPKTVNFSELARQKKEEHANRQAKYNAGILGGPQIQNVMRPPPKSLGDMPLNEIERLAKARGLKVVADQMLHDFGDYLSVGPEGELAELKARARNRVKDFLRAIEVLKLIEEI